MLLLCVFVCVVLLVGLCVGVVVVDCEDEGIDCVYLVIMMEYDLCVLDVVVVVDVMFNLVYVQVCCQLCIFENGGICSYCGIVEQ